MKSCKLKAWKAFADYIRAKYAVDGYCECVTCGKSFHYTDARHINTPYRDWETDRKSTRLNSSHSAKSRMPSSA